MGFGGSLVQGRLMLISYRVHRFQLPHILGNKENLIITLTIRGRWNRWKQVHPASKKFTAGKRSGFSGSGARDEGLKYRAVGVEG